MTKVLIVQAARGGGDGHSGKLHRLWYHGLTLPYLAALFGRRCDVQVVDELLDAPPLDTDADLVAITTMGAGLPRALELADQYRQRGKRVVLGGPTASAYPQTVAPHVDSLVMGDGEQLVERLLDDLAVDRLQPVYRHETPPPLDGTPVPRYDLIPRRRVGLFYPVEATRGCSIGCRFCLTTQLSQRRQRQKPVEDVVRDIAAIQAMGVRRVIFMDDNPTVDRGYFRKLVGAIAPLGVEWMANATAGIAEDEAMVDRLAASGCTMLAIGFETVTQANLDSSGKGCFRVDRYRQIIRRLHDSGIQVTAMMVLGFDHDSPAVFDEVLAFLNENRVEMAIFHVLTPILGTPMHAELAEQGRISELDLAHYNAEEAVFRPAQMTQRELEEGFWRLYGNVYSLGSIFRRLVARAPDRFLLRRAGSLAANLYMRHMVRQRRTIV
ncbi:MAG: B12-binding domain-containing radical SAM protein [Candidatus Wallbacteria bacterium]|nr:B12-binding domain-containing radical SAM protein [Candidatus Wallbacteria bacterium]